MFKNI